MVKPTLFLDNFHNKLIFKIFSTLKLKHIFIMERPYCIFFLNGNCKYTAETCKFEHTFPLSLEFEPKSTKEQIPIPCKFFSSGFCFKGNNCPFIHQLIENSTKSECSICLDIIEHPKLFGLLGMRKK